MIYCILIASSIFFSQSLQASKRTEAVKILALGDSVTEGHEVSVKEAYPAKLEKILKSDGYPNIEVVNAGIGGSTSASAVSRLRWHLRSKKKPAVMILALGGNDGLRGLALEKSEANLSKAIELAQKQGIKVIIAGMQIPPNYGKKYSADFAAMYPRLSKKYKTGLIPFLFQGIATDPSMFLADGIHPNPKGYEVVAKTVAKVVKEYL